MENKQVKLDSTTSHKFSNPKKNGKYHHIKLNPDDMLGWKKGSKIQVRSLNEGIDYILEFQSDGQRVTPDYSDYEDVKKWKYHADYKIICKSDADSTKKRYINKNLKNAVLVKQNYKCNLCGDKLTNEKSYHFDHKLEMSCGGLTTFDNLQVLCKNGCHQLKTFAFKKAVGEGIINPYDWGKKHEDFLIIFAKKIANGPLVNNKNNNSLPNVQNR